MVSTSCQLQGFRDSLKWRASIKLYVAPTELHCIQSRLCNCLRSLTCITVLHSCRSWRHTNDTPWMWLFTMFTMGTFPLILLQAAMSHFAIFGVPLNARPRLSLSHAMLEAIFSYGHQVFTCQSAVHFSEETCVASTTPRHLSIFKSHVSILAKFSVCTTMHQTNLAKCGNE